jgi:hypothetical protein
MYPQGISLARIIPRGFIKGLPVALIILGYLHVRKNQNICSQLIPYFIGSSVILLTYPTVAYEYNVSCLLCFIPLLFYWTKLPNIRINHFVRELMKYSFFLFIIAVSYPNHMRTLFYRLFWWTKLPSFYIVNGVYLLISTIFIVVPLFSCNEKNISLDDN